MKKKSYPVPSDEAERIKKLYEYNILDTAPEVAFDDLTLLAAYIYQTPIALISLIDENRQWLKSKVGLSASETSREVAFCAHAIMQNDVLIVSNATEDARFAQNPHVTSEPHIRFYAGAPLITPSGHKLGTICTVDRVPRELSESQVEALRALSRQVIAQLELRKHLGILDKKKEAALTAAEIKAKFLAHMSHEIRTPLNGVIGMNELLLQTKLTPSQKKIATTAKVSGESLLEIINDILDFSKIEAGKLTLEKVPFNLKTFIDESMDMLSLIAKKKKLKLRSRIDKTLITKLIGDSQRLRQILINLIGNAIKFTEKGSIELSVRKISQNHKQAKIKFQVSDTGIGMSEQTRKKIFTPFLQGDSSTNRQFGGTGLGLSISKQLVEMMGGKIEVSSTEKKGSIFAFTAAFTINSDRNSKKVQYSKKKSFGKKKIQQRLKILVAEDNPLNQEVVAGFLGKLNHQVQFANNGQEAYGLVQSNKFDLILMDCQMPVMDGYTASQKIKHYLQKKNSVVPIIAITANVLIDDKEKYLNAGIDDYLTKPLRLGLLEKTIAKWVKTSPRQNLVDYKKLTELDRLKKNTAQTNTLQLIKMFTQSHKTSIRNLKLYLKSNDIGAVKKEAHYFKSSCLAVGASGAAQLCQQIENLKTYSQGTLAFLINRLAAECVKIQDELLTWTKKLKT